MLLHMPGLTWNEPVVPTDDCMKWSKWVDQVSTKRIMCWRNRRRDYRMEAILTNTLREAKRELKRKLTCPYYRKEEKKMKQAQARQEDTDVREEMKKTICNIRLVPQKKTEENTDEKSEGEFNYDEFWSDVQDVIGINHFMDESDRLRRLRSLMKEGEGLTKWIIRREMLL